MAWSRRSVLKGLGAGSLLAGLGPGALAAGGLTPGTMQGSPYKILEIFFAGALSHRETLWVEQPNAMPTWRTLGTLDPQNDPLFQGGPSTWQAILPARGAYRTTPYGLGSGIHLGPAFAPLVAAGLANRMRVVAMGHRTDGHEPAQRLMSQGGYRVGASSRGTGPGAPISRMHGRQSFVFYASTLKDPTNAAGEFAKTGHIGRSYAPLLIPFDNPTFVAGLATSRSASRDDLLNRHREAYARRLTFAHPNLGGVAARAEAFDRYEASVKGALNGPALASRLSGLASGQQTLWDRGATRALQISAELLSASIADYCCVVDGGIVGDDLGGFSHYDSHDEPIAQHSKTTTANVLGIIAKLGELVVNGTLDLSTTLVVFTTEYGRYRKGDGTNHDANGFAVGLLGGPIQATQQSRLVGSLTLPRGNTPKHAAIGPAGGPVVSPTDLRAAILNAAGVHPFQSDLFEVDDSTQTTSNRNTAATTLSSTLFG